MNLELDAGIVSEIRRGLLAAKILGSGFTKSERQPAAISTEEIMALHYIFAREGANLKLAAELGTFLGHTANILGDLSSANAKIEIYDFFEHNNQSRKDLSKHPKFDPDNFYEIWKHNTHRNQKKFDLLRGDLTKTALARTEPLDLLFVDIVKHPSLVNIMNGTFYDRVRVGGYILHQDYYHWQSPWLVYQMEHLSDAFALVGDFGNNMSVFVKTREMTEAERQFDYINGLTNREKYDLMDIAIERYPGLRKGNLLASKLRLALDDRDFDIDALYDQIVKNFSDNKRISSYAETIIKNKNEIKNMMW